jgi:hypothetical protein
MKTHNLEKDLEFDKNLPNYYPLVNFKGKLVKYDPHKHELEKEESAEYWDFEEQKIKEGIIEAVEHSNPMGFPIYTINGKFHMYHRVWPKIENNKANLSAGMTRNEKALENAGFTVLSKKSLKTP